jgi:hypothetical protein
MTIAVDIYLFFVFEFRFSITLKLNKLFTLVLVFSSEGVQCCQRSNVQSAVAKYGQNMRFAALAQ